MTLQCAINSLNCYTKSVYCYQRGTGPKFSFTSHAQKTAVSLLDTQGRRISSYTNAAISLHDRE